MNTMPLPRITSVRHVGDFRLALEFTDSSRGQVDLRDWILGQGGVFAPLEDPAYFAQVRLSQTGGTIEWPNGVDFCPDVLHHLATGRPLPSDVSKPAAPDAA